MKSFNKKSYILAMTALMMLLVSGCSGDNAADEPYAPVSLSVDFSTCSDGLTLASTKALTDSSLFGLDDPDHPENMAPGALAVDGRIMAELVVLVVKDGDIVAYRDIHRASKDLDADNGFLDASGKVDTALSYASRAKVTFSHAGAKHGENLKRGAYKLYAAALPYGDIAGKYYGDLFDGFVKVRNALNEGRPVPFQDIYDTKIDISKAVDGETSEFPFLYPKVGQWVSGETDVTLRYGANKARLELLRTSARVRIDITNASSQPLLINDMSFGEGFTRKDSWLFSRSDLSQNYYETELGAPAVGSDRAIIPFIGSVDNPVSIDAGRRQAVFDGYVNENKNLNNPFTYSLSVYYDGMEAEFRADGEPYSSLDELKDGTTFYIGKYDRQEFLYHWFSGTGDSRYEIIRADQSTNEAIFYNPDRNYIWQLEHADGDADGVFVLKSLSLLHDTEVYVAPAGYSSVSSVRDMNYQDQDTGEWFNYGSLVVLTADDKRFARFKPVLMENSSFAFKVVDRNGNDIMLNSNNIYLNIAGGVAKKDVGFWPEAPQENDMFQLYPVHSVVGDATIMTIKEDGVPVTEIRRNDFLRIHLKVSYNKNVGQFVFDVADWDEKSGETTFD